jgi:hypothetical protein
MDCRGLRPYSRQPCPERFPARYPPRNEASYSATFSRHLSQKPSEDASEFMPENEDFAMLSKSGQIL